MICCKIIADVTKVKENFGPIFSGLSSYGNVRWEDSVFYFGSTGINTNKNTIKRIFKKNGCSEVIVIEYTKDYQPQETKDAVNGWLIDQLMQINFLQCENALQESFRNTMKGLDAIDAALREQMQTGDKEEKS